MVRGSIQVAMRGVLETELNDLKAGSNCRIIFFACSKNSIITKVSSHEIKKRRAKRKRTRWSEAKNFKSELLE